MSLTDRANPPKPRDPSVASPDRRDWPDVDEDEAGLLEIVAELDSIGQAGSVAGIEATRRLSYLGNSLLSGLQMRARLGVYCIAPSRDDPTMLDTAHVSGVVRVRRFRPIEWWPVFRLGRFAERPTPTWDQNRFPIDPEEKDHPGLMREFCSGVLPPLKCTRHGDGLYYDVGNGPVGRRGEFTCCFGYLNRNFVQRHGNAPESSARLISWCTMPTEQMLMDVFVHESLGIEVLPDATAYGAVVETTTTLETTTPLSFDAPVEDLGPAKPVPGVTSVPRYSLMMERVFARAQWEASEFRCHRLLVPFPPVSVTLAVSLRLPTA